MECKGRIRQGARRLVCYKCKCQSHIQCMTTTRSQADVAFQMQGWCCPKCIQQQNATGQPTNQPIRLDPKTTGAKQAQIRILQWNANGIHRELPLLEELLEKNNVDIACIQESRLLPKDRTPELHHFNAIRRDRPVQGEARGGGLLTYVRKTLSYRLLEHAGNEEGALERLTVEIPVPQKQLITVSNWYLPPENSHFLQRIGFSMEDFHPTLSESEIVCADLNAHDQLWDPVANSDERGELLAEAVLDANGAFLNDGRPTRQDPAHGHLSAPDVTIVHESLQDKCEWLPLDCLSSDHKPIITTLLLPAEKLRGQKRLVWDWKRGKLQDFTEAVENALIGGPDITSKNMNVQYERLCTAVLAAATKHIGLKAVGMSGECWMTKEIVDAEKERDEIRAHSGINSTDYKAKDKLVKAMLKSRKAEIWERRILSVKGKKEMWSVLRSLTNTRSQDKARIITDNGATFVSPRQKANAFARLYKDVSTLTINKEDRGLKKILNSRLRTNNKVPEECGDFTLSEVKAALKSLNPSKAAGPDKIHPRFLHHLGPVAISTLRSIFNLSWSTAKIPQAWRVADIRPIPKAGKDQQRLDSYRPVSLTSTVGKVMERLVTNRLRFLTETNHTLQDSQAGFRFGRSTEDQLLRLSQSISDGFQSKPMQRTLLALIDYSRAYDRVWRDALLLKMSQQGIPSRIVRWVQAWLSNRLAWVTFDGEKSKPVTLKQGVPQGSVLSPLLFILYINDLTTNIKTPQISLYADDVAIWTQESNLQKAEGLLQESLDELDRWSRKWKMELSTSKSECSFFTTNTHEAKWRPTLTLSGQPLRYNSNPKFLGVTYDRQLTFAPHAANIGRKLKRQAGALRCLATTEWGYDKSTLRSTYIATGRSSVEYAAAAWLPWISPATMGKLETCQRFAG